ncbi:MAG TPA: UDP-N-acetylmuramate dehydrogenase [Candidatus Babeliales bacterium]|jgi:UDP-N-acetylmuramate dehydrogenase|nr:UDP-N-acetylmuramate dehydrogenase [Candidatus Babeliales bacterium]
MKPQLLIQENFTLKDLNTFGVEAKARYFINVQNREELQQLLNLENYRSVSKFILGEGSNTLFTKDYPGLVIKMTIKGIQIIDEDMKHIWIEAGGGENWHDFVMYCVNQGYAGIENLSLIPGTVGAAPIQNIGAYGAELSDVLFQLTAINIQTGSVHTFTNEACHFSYRDSIFKNALKDQYIIVSVILRLNKVPEFNIHYGNLKETLDNIPIEELNIKTISDAVIRIRRSKLPDPKKIGNAGSFFKNPIVSQNDFLKLQKIYPKMPYFLTDDENTIKISAAWLIEQCGWKGKRFGDIGVYEKQALILVNYAKGNAAEIKNLAEQIQQSVYQQFGIFLHPEVVFV